jgi:hypothetical protein
MSAELHDLVWQYQVASEAERPGLLAQIRQLADPAKRDHRDRVPPLMPCREHGAGRVELIDSKAWLFLCHECGELYRNNGDEGLAELLLEEEENDA